MKRATLLYNPRAGSNRAKRLEAVERAKRVLVDAGVAAECVATQSADSAGAQARDAIQRGSDTVLACGGDGTLHDTLQGVVGTDAAVGVIPLGTANALANDLRIPAHPERAARTILQYKPRWLPAGTISYARREGEPATRYFTVMAGVGPDAAMVYELSAKWKNSLGLLSYLVKSAQLFLSHHFATFEVEYDDLITGMRHTTQTISVMAVRITDFGNVLRKLAPGAALENADLRIVILTKHPRINFLLHLTSALVGYRPGLPGIKFASASEVRCHVLDGHREEQTIRAEADGEHLGRLPVTIGIRQRAFRLLMPPDRA
ncbi:MAG: diacylglycerol kinase family lipid kinase [Acidobacteriales bacterium]|nr:diacylglycerol kinase family lipid kinase [Terriglobales bacterium]